MVDLQGFVIFGVISGVLGVAAAYVAVRLLFCRLGIWKGTSWRRLSHWQRKTQVVFLAVGGALLVAFIWSFIEPYHPAVKVVRLSSDKIRSPIRIVHISDTHCDATRRAEDRVVAMVKKASPHLILFTGDGVNSDEGIGEFKHLMQQLSRIAPLYGVRGNWEAWWFADEDTFADTGMIELSNRPKKIRVGAQDIWLIGAPVDGEKGFAAAARRLPTSAYRIGLHHFPSAVSLLDGRVDLMLAGDTHGGQIALPIIGPLIQIRRWGGPFYTTGLHRTPLGTNLYVNQGIGMEGGSVPRVRFNVPPEVTLIEIHPQPVTR